MPVAFLLFAFHCLLFFKRSKIIMDSNPSLSAFVYKACKIVELINKKRAVKIHCSERKERD